MTKDDFYVGYQDRAPVSVGGTMRRVAVALIVVAVALAAGLTAEQDPFNDAVFEFLEVKTFEGVLRSDPVPMLEVTRPSSEGASVSSYLLVKLGKHGADDLVDGREGQRARIDGTLVYNGAVTLIEVADGGVEILDGTPSSRAEPARRLLGSRRLVGEIVDSKCWLGVMKPARLKTHRACAINCIAGGIPPLFVVTNGDDADVYLLVGSDGRTVNAEVLDFVGESLIVTGDVAMMGEWLVLSAEPTGFTPAAP